MKNADGSVVIAVEMDVDDADKELANFKKEIERVEEEVRKTEAQRAPIVEQLEAAKKAATETQLRVSALNKELAKSEAVTSIHAAPGSVDPMRYIDELENQKRIREELTRQEGILERESKTYAKLNTKAAQLTEKLNGQKAELQNLEESAGDLVKRLVGSAKATEDMGNATKKANKHMGKFALRVRAVVRSALVFTLITQALGKFREWVGKVIKTDEKAVAAIAELKGALLTLAQPLTGIIIPALTGFVRILTQAVLVAARLVSALFGKTIKQSADAAKELNKETDALEGLGSAAKEAQSALAGFDEVNQIATESASTLNDQIIEPDFSAVSSLPQWLEDVVSSIELKIKEIYFAWEPSDIFGQRSAWKTIFGAALGAVIGGVFGGWTGAVIGLLLGASISLVSLAFEEGKMEDWDKKDTLIVALSSMLGLALGAIFGGFNGAVIGLLLGASISFTSLAFGEDIQINKDKTIASLRVALLTLLGFAFGHMFGGLAGGVVFAMVGLSVGFASVAFDEDLDASIRETSKKALMVALSTLIGTLIGAVFGGGVFGGIVGGVIGLSFGLALTFAIESYEINKDKKLDVKFDTDFYDWMAGGSFNISPKAVPGLARGGVIPPNRKFMAVLGDNKTETEVVSPLSTMKQAMIEAMREAGGEGGSYTFVVNLDGKEIARNQVKHINNMTMAAGKPVLLV